MTVPTDTRPDFMRLEHTDIPPVTGSQAPLSPGEAVPETEKQPEAGQPRFGRTRASRPAPRPTPVRDSTPKAIKPPKPAVTDDVLTKALSEMYAFGAVMLMPVDQVCATAIVNSAEPCAQSLVKLSKENASVRRVLEGLTQTSAWGAVIAAHLPIAMAVAGHHFSNKPKERELHSVPDDEAPRNIRHTGPAGGQVGKFCPDCDGAMVNGVMHTCPPNGAA